MDWLCSAVLKGEDQVEVHQQQGIYALVGVAIGGGFKFELRGVGSQQKRAKAAGTEPLAKHGSIIGISTSGNVV